MLTACDIIIIIIILNKSLARFGSLGSWRLYAFGLFKPVVDMNQCERVPTFEILEMTKQFILNFIVKLNFFIKKTNKNLDLNRYSFCCRKITVLPCSFQKLLINKETWEKVSACKILKL